MRVRGDMGSLLGGAAYHASVGGGLDQPTRGTTWLDRRRFLAAGGAAAASVALGALPGCAPAPLETFAPVRRITRGPGFHWFGYYDKLQFDPSDRYVLSNRVAFEDRSPRKQDEIRVGMVDTAEGDRWIDLGGSRAWSWQQGCMLQWRPGKAREVVWNDRDGERFVARLLDVKTGVLRTLPRPVYALSPDGHFALTADFARIQRMRPGYGYAGGPDPHEGERAPRDSGVWRMDLETGATRLVLSLAEAAALPHAEGGLEDRWHYFNHLLVSPDAQRFIVLHRWREAMWHPKGVRALLGFTTRMLTVSVDGSEPTVLDPSGYTSHFIWRDPAHVCAWTRPRGREDGFYLFRDRSDRVEPVGAGVMTRNGHVTYLPGLQRNWILNDTYPDLPGLRQTLYLFHTASGRRVDLGHFPSTLRYFGERRCDLHPRASNGGRVVAIDSTHGGDGRQIYLVDVGAVVGA